MATPDIKGFFSQEHSVLVFLIALSLWANWNTYNKVNELSGEMKLVIYRLNNDGKTKKQLAKADIHGCSGKSELQAPSSLLAVIRRNPLYCFESTD